MSIHARKSAFWVFWSWLQALRPGFLLVCAPLSSLLFGTSAHAHPNALSRVDAHIDSARVRVEFDLDGTSAVDLIQRELGLDAPPRLEDLARYQRQLLGYIDLRFELRADATTCQQERGSSQRFSRAKNRVYLRIQYGCPHEPREISLRSELFSEESTPHQVLGEVHSAGRFEGNLLERDVRVTFDLSALPKTEPARHRFRMATPPSSARVSRAPPKSPIGASETAAPAPPPEARPKASVKAGGLGFRSFLLEGLRHILGGYDHLLFVCVLVLGALSLRELTKWITAFTLAHSLSLALSALELVVVSPRLVEPLIALSIVWVGVETLRGVRSHTRLPLVFGFGLLHGLGFGGALRDLGLSGHDIVVPLLGFNLGVELGQLVVIVPCFALLRWQRKHRASWSVPVRTWSAASLSLIAAIWFIERALA